MHRSSQLLICQFSTLLRALQMCWEHRTKWAEPFCSERGWVMTRTATLFSRLCTQGQDTVCQQHSIGQSSVLAQETVLYSQHQKKTHSSRLLFSVFQMFIHFSSAFIFTKLKNKQDSLQQHCRCLKMLSSYCSETHTHTEACAHTLTIPTSE